MAIIRKFVRCGKPSCRTCPHGPYYYEAKREGKKVRFKYLGRIPPEKTS